MDMEKSTPKPKVCILIVNWNGREDTIACLDSLSRINYPNYEIFLVDNASTDESISAVEQRFPAVRIVANSDNLGFVGGNNAGILAAQQSNPDYLLLLNNDTETSPEFLTELVEAVDPDPAIGIAGPMIYYFDDPQRIWSAGGRIRWRRGDSQMLGLNRYDVQTFGSKPYPVDFVTGCCLLIRSEVVEKIGLLDERFFMYYEETEWCTRAAAAGYRIYCVPTARIWHKISLQARDDSPQVNYYMVRNRLLFLRLNKASWTAWFNTLIRDYARTYISWTLKPRWRVKKQAKQALVRGILDFSRGHFGKVDIRERFLE